MLQLTVTLGLYHAVMMQVLTCGLKSNCCRSGHSTRIALAIAVVMAGIRRLQMQCFAPLSNMSDNGNARISLMSGADCSGLA
jgi:hypothetical protein